MNFKKILNVLTSGEYQFVYENPDSHQFILGFVDAIKRDANHLTPDQVNDLELCIEVLQMMYNNSGLPNLIDDDEYDLIYAVYKKYTDKDIVGAPLVAGKLYAT